MHKEKIETKITLITSFWSALQGALIIFWSLYIHFYINESFIEASMIGCILLIFTILYSISAPIIKKISLAVLLTYSIFAAILGILLIAVASPKIWVAWTIFFIIISNLALTLYHYFSIQMTALIILSMIILTISSMV